MQPSIDVSAVQSSARGPPLNDTAFVYQIGQRVRTTSGVGVIEFIAFSNAMQSPVYTVALDSRIKLRLLARDLIPV